jgi:hypothetical protein
MQPPSTAKALLATVSLLVTAASRSTSTTASSAGGPADGDLKLDDSASPASTPLRATPAAFTLSADGGGGTDEDGDAGGFGSGSVELGGGRLLVWLNGTWGSVCDDEWTEANSVVACRQLGFDGAAATTTELTLPPTPTCFGAVLAYTMA